MRKLLCLAFVGMMLSCSNNDEQKPSVEAKPAIPVIPAFSPNLHYVDGLSSNEGYYTINVLHDDARHTTCYVSNWSSWVYGGHNVSTSIFCVRD